MTRSRRICQEGLHDLEAELELVMGECDEEGKVEGGGGGAVEDGGDEMEKCSQPPLVGHLYYGL